MSFLCYKTNCSTFTFTQLWVVRKSSWDLRWRLHLSRSPQSAEMPLKGRISPVRNTYFAHPSPFLPGLTDSHPVREVCRPPGTLPGGDLSHRAAGSPGSSKTFQRSASPPISADAGSGCAAWAPLLGWRWNCAHTSSVYFLQDLEYRCWFTTAGHVLRCVVHAPDLWNKTKERGHLSFIDLTMNGSMRVAP